MDKMEVDGVEKVREAIKWNLIELGVAPESWTNSYPQDPKQLSDMLQNLQSARGCGLGILGVYFHDGWILRIFEDYLELKDLVICSLVSKAFYAFATHEELWRFISFEKHGGNFNLRSNWKLTYFMPKDSIEPDEIKKPIYSFDINDEKFLTGFQGTLLHRRWYRSNCDMSVFEPPTNGVKWLERRSAKDLSFEEFQEKYEKTSTPVVITDVIDHWPAVKYNRWSVSQLQQDYPDMEIKISLKVSGKRLRMPMKNFLYYAQHNYDEDPLYMFDPGFDKKSPKMSEEYSTISYLEDDLWNYLDKIQTNRPFKKWLLIGPPRSGTKFHRDPLKTSAWNAMLAGRKRWAIYPPSVPKPPEYRNSYYLDDEFEPRMEMPQWFLEKYPFLPEELKPLETILGPGEVIFVPGGWWHSVLNLDIAVAVTENIVTPSIFSNVWNDMISKKHYRKKCAKWKRELEKSRPDIKIPETL